MAAHLSPKAPRRDRGPHIAKPMDLTLKPISHLSARGAGDARWLAFGSDPAFRCGWPTPEPLQGGWYWLAFEVEVHKGKMHAPCLYIDYGRGHFLEAEKVELSLDHATAGVHVVQRMLLLHSDVTALRFDPSVLPAEFTIRKLGLTRIGRRAALSCMVADLAPAERPAALARAGMDLLVGGPRKMADSLYHGYSARRRGSGPLHDYGAWVDLYDANDAESVSLRAQAMNGLRQMPVFSVLVPTYNTDEKWLRLCIESVRRQAYPNWELCIADDASTNPAVRRVIEEYAAQDARIKVAFRTVNGHIAEASNTALSLATGEWIALLDHDDELSPLALLECALAIDSNPNWRMLFTDEDKIDGNGDRSDPYFKPDWNPELFESQNCVCHLGVFARDLVMELGGFRKGLEGAQDWDLALRVTERLQPGQVGHVAKVLYHWRMIEGSTALAPGEKSYAHDAARRALAEHLDRVDPGSEVVEIAGCSGYFRIRHALPDPLPLVSVLIPTRDRVELLRQCVDSVLAGTDYGPLEVLVLDNGSEQAATLDYMASLVDEPRVRIIRIDMPFNFSAINNRGAREARGEILVLLNNDIEVIDRGWLRELVSHAVRPDVGAVGAMLYYPNDTVQHAGVVLGIGGVAGHAYVGLQRGNPGDKHRAALTQAVSAVTGACLAVRAEVFREVGGLDETLAVAFNDIDFCIRVSQAGYRNIWTPFAELYHHESASRGYEDTPEKVARFKKEESLMKQRWGELLQNDPYYNVNLALDTVPYHLAYPPRGWHAEGDPSGQVGAGGSIA
jgi:GT2 family glycosyltransferase